MKRRDGLTKYCDCKDWGKCRHPWHFQFFHKKCACARGCACKENRTRASLHKVAKKPLGYFMSKSEAEALADRLRTNIREGSHALLVVQGVATVNDLCDRFLAERVNLPGRRRDPIAAATNYVNIVRRLPVGGRAFGQKPLTAVEAAHLEELREARRRELNANARLRAEGKKGRLAVPLEKGGEVGVEHLMATVRQMFSWACKWDLVKSSPFKRNGEVVVPVRNPLVVRERDRRLVGDEEARLLANAQPHQRDVIVALLQTGCRVGEILSLQWRDVHDGYLMIRAEKAKTAKARAVPITAALREVLARRRKGPDGEELGPDAYVFGDECGGRIGRVRRAWDRTCERAGIVDLHIHDLRREFASRLAEAGARHHEVRDWIGHTNVATTSRYLKASAERLRAVAALVPAGKVDGMLTEGRAGQ